MPDLLTQFIDSYAKLAGLVIAGWDVLTAPCCQSWSTCAMSLGGYVVGRKLNYR